MLTGDKRVRLRAGGGRQDRTAPDKDGRGRKADEDCPQAAAKTGNAAQHIATTGLAWAGFGESSNNAYL